MSSWRTVVVSQSAKLDYQMGFLIVRSGETRKVHLEELHTLIIESTAVSITAYLLQELVKHKVKVIFCDVKRNPSAELIPYYGSHDTSIKVRNQIEWSEEVKTAVWTEIIAEKIKQQAELLKVNGKTEEILLRSYIDELEFEDSTNREGHAAKVYFNALFGKKFSRSDENSINAALNYGYSLLLSSFNREISACGYITQLGLSHSNRFNPFNLASDLMEPFRPLVDRRVIKLNPEIFETDEKHFMVGLLSEEVLINGRSEYIPNAVKIYVKSIFDILNSKGEGEIRFYKVL